MPKWFLGKRRHKSPPSFHTTSPADLNLQYSFHSSIYHQPGLLLQQSTPKKRIKQDEDAMNREVRLSRASPDSGYSHSPLSYSYYIDHDNTDIEYTESADASLNQPNHPLDLSCKTTSATFRKVIYETISTNVDFLKSEQPITGSIYQDNVQKVDSSDYRKSREVLYDTGTDDCGEVFKDVIAARYDSTSTSSCSVAPISRHTNSDVNDGEKLQSLIDDQSARSANVTVIHNFNSAAAQVCGVLQCGLNADQEIPSKMKLKNNDISRMNESKRKDEPCSVLMRREHLANGIEVNTRKFAQIFSSDMNEIQSSRCLDSITYRKPDREVLSSGGTFGVRYKQNGRQTVPISHWVEAKHELITADEIRSSDESTSSIKYTTAPPITREKKLLRAKPEKLSTKSKSSKLVGVRQSDDYYKCDNVETFCRGDLDTSLTLVDATPEARAEIEKIENKIGDYACMLCCEIFSDAFQLAGHNCSGIVHVEYRCPECSKTFNCPANLASHRRWHKPQRTPAVMSEWSLDELLQSSHYLDRIQTMSKFGKPLLL